jgi:hypothetical protein
MKAIDLIKNNIFTLLNGGCSNNEIYDAIEEIENMKAKLKQGQDNYNKLWDMYSELRKEKRSNK